MGRPLRHPPFTRKDHVQVLNPMGWTVHGNAAPQRACWRAAGTYSLTQELQCNNCSSPEHYQIW